jgi:hypothetical protein
MPDRQDDLNPTDLGPFADALKQLAPQPANLSRDALLFAAGKAAGGSHLPAWLWPTSTGSFAALSLVLAGFLVSPSAPAAVQYVERTQVVYMERHADADLPGTAHSISPPTERPKTKSRTDDSSVETLRMMQVRRDVLRWGIDMLPESKSSGGGASQDVAASDFKHWLNLPPGTFASSGLLPRKPSKREEDE